jgi:nicotinamidase-related amidase
MSAFTNTTLDVLLRNRKIETVLCTGVATHGCVLSTAYSAMARDFYVVVVDDCVASSSRELHDLSLLLMRKVVHEVVSSQQLINLWNQALPAYSS